MQHASNRRQKQQPTMESATTWTSWQVAHVVAMCVMLGVGLVMALAVELGAIRIDKEQTGRVLYVGILSSGGTLLAAWLARPLVLREAFLAGYSPEGRSARWSMLGARVEDSHDLKGVTIAPTDKEDGFVHMAAESHRPEAGWSEVVLENHPEKAAAAASDSSDDEKERSFPCC